MRTRPIAVACERTGSSVLYVHSCSRLNPRLRGGFLIADKHPPRLRPRVSWVSEEKKAHPPTRSRVDTGGSLTVMTKRKTRMSRCPLL